jgi:hypothetical protein
MYRRATVYGQNEGGQENEELPMGNPACRDAGGRRIGS